jgi:hypothetical protein
MNHKCKPLIHRHKVIPAASYFISIDGNGLTNIVIDGLDHIGYVFEVKEPKIVPVELPCDNYQPTGNTKNNNQEGNRTKDSVTSPIEKLGVTRRLTGGLGSTVLLNKKLMLGI